MKKDCSVIILAAGYSGRMGQIKFSLKMKDGKIFLEHILQQFSKFGCYEMVVVINREGKSFLDQHAIEFPENVRFILNEHPGYERFYSVKLGLSAINRNRFVFIHNADNPFVEQDVLEQIFEKREEADIVKPVYKGKGGHPILISDKIRAEIISETENNIRLDDFLRKYPQKRVNVGSEKILININTPDDYQKL